MTAPIDIGLFPSWTTMIVMDVLMILLAATPTYIAVLRWPLLCRARALIGTALILAGFWIMALLYTYDLITMTLLPRWIGMAAAMEEMGSLHTNYSWYIHLVSAILIVVGLANTSKRLEQLDELLQDSKREAEAQSAQKTRFLASMSHELRTPLNAIMGYADFMQMEPIASQKERCQEYAANIRSSSQMLHDLISDLLDLSRIEQGRVKLNFQSIDLVSVIRECISQVEKTGASQGVAISLDVTTDISALYLDRRAIEQVTLNLITNSAKHTPPGGQIDISINATDCGKVQLVFSDSGSGIPPHILADIFEPYVCGDPLTKSADRSYGLGLSICKRLIDAHNGASAVNSELGHGATVTVILPYAPKDTSQARNAA